MLATRAFRSRFDAVRLQLNILSEGVLLKCCYNVGSRASAMLNKHERRNIYF